MRYYLGVDWADQTHAVWVVDEQGAKVASRVVPHTAAGLSEWGRELDEWRAQGIELWTAIERPEGRVVDFLLDHGVVVYPVNPKALDRARDRFRPSAAKSDPFDARVLAEFLRTDHRHLHPGHIDERRSPHASPMPPMPISRPSTMRTAGGRSGHQRARPTAKVIPAHVGNDRLRAIAVASMMAPTARSTRPRTMTSVAPPR
jgi:hypothetical protein